MNRRHSFPLILLVALLVHRYGACPVRAHRCRDDRLLPGSSVRDPEYPSERPDPHGHLRQHDEQRLLRRVPDPDQHGGRSRLHRHRSVHAVQLDGTPRQPPVLRLFRPGPVVHLRKQRFHRRGARGRERVRPLLERRFPELADDAADRHHAEGPYGRDGPAAARSTARSPTIPSAASTSRSPPPKPPRTPPIPWPSYFVFDTGNSGTSNFDVRRVSNGNSLDSAIRVNVTVPLPVEGVLQSVVGLAGARRARVLPHERRGHGRHRRREGRRREKAVSRTRSTRSTSPGRARTPRWPRRCGRRRGTSRSRTPSRATAPPRVQARTTRTTTGRSTTRTR